VLNVRIRRMPWIFIIATSLASWTLMLQAAAEIFAIDEHPGPPHYRSFRKRKGACWPPKGSNHPKMAVIERLQFGPQPRLTQEADMGSN
jgi:hypothetical protein